MLTLNNYTPEEKQFISNIEGEVLADEEVGEEGTPHIHAYIHFGAAKRLSTLKKLLPRAHWDPVKIPSEARNYCRKGMVFRDDTTPVEQRQRGSRTRELVQIVLTQGLRQALEEDPYLFCKNRAMLISVWSFAQS